MGNAIPREVQKPPPMQRGLVYELSKNGRKRSRFGGSTALRGGVNLKEKTSGGGELRLTPKLIPLLIDQSQGEWGEVAST